MIDSHVSRRARRTVPIVTIFVTALVGPQFAPPAGRAEQPSSVVVLKDHRFEPTLIDVKPGDTIRFDNADDSLHSLTLLGREDVIGEEFIDPGKSHVAHIPADMPSGTYELDCTIHVEMRAQLLVRER